MTLDACSYRRSHRYPVSREIPNSRHKALILLPPTRARMTKAIRCSCKFTCFHGIGIPFARIRLVRSKCQGCPARICQVCVATVQHARPNSQTYEQADRTVFFTPSYRCAAESCAHLCSPQPGRDPEGM